MSRCGCASIKSCRPWRRRPTCSATSKLAQIQQMPVYSRPRTFSSRCWPTCRPACRCWRTWTQGAGRGGQDIRQDGGVGAEAVAPMGQGQAEMMEEHQREKPAGVKVHDPPLLLPLPPFSPYCCSAGAALLPRWAPSSDAASRSRPAPSSLGQLGGAAVAWLWAV